MCNLSSTDSSAEPSALIDQFEQLRITVESEFEVKEGFMEHGIPTFHMELRQDSKKAFLRLMERLDTIGFIPVLRRKEGKAVLQIIHKPSVPPSRQIINVVLLFATIGTTLLTGYFLSLWWVNEGFMSNPMIGATAFTGAIMAILGSHEMGHKLAANRHGVEATMPYFIPGLPWPLGIGTFGAVIKQKSLPPNKDALFDIGASGPLAGFIVTIIVTIIGVPLSRIILVSPGAPLSPAPLLFWFISILLPPAGEIGNAIRPHPVAFAGYVGMIVTMLNLLPTGMLDGGHAVRGLLGEKAHSILTFLSIMVLFFLGPEFWAMAFLVLILSIYRHPGPLDDVSKLATNRKLATLALVAIFILSLPI